MKRILLLFLSLISNQLLSSEIYLRCANWTVNIPEVSERVSIPSYILTKLLIANECLEQRLSIAHAIEYQESNSYFRFKLAKILDDLFTAQEICEIYKMACKGLSKFVESDKPSVKAFLNIKLCENTDDDRSEQEIDYDKFRLNNGLKTKNNFENEYS